MQPNMSIPCPSVQPSAAISMLERMAGRPLSATERYTGQYAGHGTYDWPTILGATPVYDVRHRYGFNTAGRTVGGVPMNKMMMWMLIGVAAAWVTRRQIADPIRRRIGLKRLSPNTFAVLFGALAGGLFASWSTPNAQKQLAKAQQQMAQQQQQAANQQQ